MLLRVNNLECFDIYMEHLGEMSCYGFIMTTDNVLLRSTTALRQSHTRLGRLPVLPWMFLMLMGVAM